MVHLSAVSKNIWQEVGGMISHSPAPGIVIRAPDWISERESGDKTRCRSTSNMGFTVVL